MTVAEDLKVIIEAGWNDGSIDDVVYVLMNSNQATGNELEPPTVTTGKCVIIIPEFVGIRFRIGGDSDLVTYEGEILVYCLSYANMKTSLAELKQLFNDYSDGGTDGTIVLTDPSIIGENSEAEFISAIRITWNRVITRG